ncbi:MAG: hypothetical protein HQ592_18415, partial [Planctomycetes bacterium]|nr:hypothetical protein [Planctomycetota bacterium]
MDRRWTVAVLIVCVMVGTAWADVPGLINYQGKLDDAGGEPVSGVRSMTFEFRDAPAAGNLLGAFSETQAVTVTDGLFSILIGSATGGGVPQSIFDGADVYLSVTVEVEELTPRQRVASVGFAFKAADADNADAAGHADMAGDADTVDGVHAAALEESAEITDAIDAEASARAAADDAESTARATTDIALAGRVAALETLLASMSLNGNDVTFSGVNVRIVNGTGTTDGTVNGLGNLIVGHNELRGSGDDRSGSHNIVVGRWQNFTSYGGLVAGHYNTISGQYASVSGGSGNTASGNGSSVSGGMLNGASGPQSSVSGGVANTASGYESSVSGGSGNTASGNSSSVSGGEANTTSGYGSSVGGGSNNAASGGQSSVSGGAYNTASGPGSSASGGLNNTAGGVAASVAGGGGPDAADGNEAFADYSAILGGIGNIAGDPDLLDNSIGQNATVSGGDGNTASG